ncbi:MAG: FMN-binding glutamate synthase family protein [Planctomycetales bacterium]|nr:FMN-binding glutamate synthase family protein [Planctomycetales bacterium]
MGWTILLLVVGGLMALVIHDVTQRKHAVLHNFPIIGHFRYWLEAIGPELRQYIVTSNDEERPFSRDQRRWVYASSKNENNYFGFGSDDDFERPHNRLLIKHAVFPYVPPPVMPTPSSADVAAGVKYPIPVAKVLGGSRGRAQAFRPPSILNVSAMSFGSLSAPAIEAINRGCRLAGCLHNTGEGGISPYHDNGGELIWQIGTGYFGCRDERGDFSLDRFLENVQRHPVRAIEIKLSQGAKPGVGGIVPGAKVTPEVAAIRGVPVGQDCISPPRHSAFHDADSMLDFVERLADASGLPVGIKSAVGEAGFWTDLARLMADGKRGVDFITVDGGDGGTGAAPLVFADHVSLPFRVAIVRVYRTFVEHGLHERVVFIGSGRLGFPETALLAMALGCDMVNVGRTAMLSIGCIQAQRCHTGHCPTGVATQNRWLMRGLDPTLKSARLANYVTTLRKEMLQLSHACGHCHPALVTLDAFDIMQEAMRSVPAREMVGYEAGWGLPAPEDRRQIEKIMRGEVDGVPSPAKC